MRQTILKIKNNLTKEKLKKLSVALWTRFRGYMRKILDKSLEGTLVKIITGGMLIALGFFGNVIYEQWNPDIVSVNIVGIVVDGFGEPIADAEVRAKGIEGITKSKLDGTFSYVLEAEKDTSLITFYCNKTGYKTSTNNRELPKETSPYENGEKIIQLSFQLQPLSSTQIIKN